MLRRAMGVAGGWVLTWGLGLSLSVLSAVYEETQGG
jgi:hypothetical protein